jgi:uncharacterized membrane protein YkoI
MKPSIAVVVALVALAGEDAFAQRARVTISGGEVTSSRALERDASRLAPRIPGVTSEVRARLRVTGDSAQRIALDDFDWRGRVSSLEVDEQDARLFWDVKIVPDSTRGTIVRYRIDATNGGILDIREFTGIRGLSRDPRL